MYLRRKPSSGWAWWWASVLGWLTLMPSIPRKTRRLRDGESLLLLLLLLQGERGCQPPERVAPAEPNLSSSGLTISRSPATQGLTPSPVKVIGFSVGR